MRFPVLTVLSLVLLGALAACSSDEPEAPKPVAEKPAETRREPVREVAPPKPPSGVVTASGPVVDPSIQRKLERVVNHPLRVPQNMARDIYRHPKETLGFFGIQQNMTVVEITPGAGWYTEILAPLLKQMGHYAVAVWDEKVPGQPDYRAELNRSLENKLAAQPKYFSRVDVRRFDPRMPVFGPPMSADMVLSFRNAHNWIDEGTAPLYFKAMADVLKPGGVLGIVDHRAPEGPATDGKSGYVTEEQIIELAVTAGFVLVDRSEVNANPKDTKDHPEGVWTLPPSLALGETDKARYIEIGESDRMTLKFLRQ